jgi:hypothetical protein
MKQLLSPRRILIRTVIIVIALLAACLACNIFAYRFLPLPNG